MFGVGGKVLSYSPYEFHEHCVLYFSHQTANVSKQCHAESCLHDDPYPVKRGSCGFAQWWWDLPKQLGQGRSKLRARNKAWKGDICASLSVRRRKWELDGNQQALIFCYSFDLYQSFFTSKVRIMPASTEFCNNDAEEFYLENNALQSRRGSIKVCYKSF